MEWNGTLINGVFLRLKPCYTLLIAWDGQNKFQIYSEHKWSKYTMEESSKNNLDS